MIVDVPLVNITGTAPAVVPVGSSMSEIADVFLKMSNCLFVAVVPISPVAVLSRSCTSVSSCEPHQIYSEEVLITSL